MVKEILLVAHGDVDGIISAVCAVQRYKLELGETEIIFVQPFTVDKMKIPDGTKWIIVVDIAVNNRDPEMTKDLIRRIGNRLLGWYDHHQGWTAEIIGNRPKIVVFPRRSCAEVIGGDPELVADATAADTREGTLSPRAQLIEQAMKANMADDSIRQLAVNWLLGDEAARVGLEAAAKKYVAIQVETEWLAATYQVIGNVALVDARQSNHQYDLTQLLLEGQKLAPFAVVLTVHPQQGQGLTIATRKTVDMVELFGLGSGAPFRVSLPASRQEEALTKLQSIKFAT